MHYVYSDGSCPSNGKPTAIGGWACIKTDSPDVFKGEIIDSRSGRVKPGDDILTATSIRMELRAAIEALRMCPENERVTLYSDSAYVINGIRDKWYLKWFRTGKNTSGNPPANMDLWVQLVHELEIREVWPEHIKGHKGHRFQEMCDTLAVQKARGVQ